MCTKTPSSHPTPPPPAPPQVIDLIFMAPPTGRYDFTLTLMSSTWVGADLSVPARLRVNPLTRAQAEGRDPKSLEKRKFDSDSDDEGEPRGAGEGGAWRLDCGKTGAAGACRAVRGGSAFAQKPRAVLFLFLARPCSANAERGSAAGSSDESSDDEGEGDYDSEETGEEVSSDEGDEPTPKGSGGGGSGSGGDDDPPPLAEEGDPVAEAKKDK
jgi:hypothetical protein